MNVALEFFTYFGGLDIQIDTSKDLYSNIVKLILDDYHKWHQEIIDITLGDSVYHSILTGVALGDGRISSSLKRAKVSSETGKNALDYLEHSGIIEIEKNPDKDGVDKIHFSKPFYRFWFAFVSPIYQGIIEMDYEEFSDRLQSREAEFSDYIFTQLSQSFLQETLEDKITDIGGYWNNSVDIDIYAKTASGKTIVGACKNSLNKIKKSVLSKLKEDTKELSPDYYVVFARGAYSKELKSLKSDELKLFTLKSFKTIL